MRRALFILALLAGCTTPLPYEDAWSSLREYTPAQQQQAATEFVELCKMGAMSCVLIRDYMELRLKVRDCRPAGGL